MLIYNKYATIFQMQHLHEDTTHIYRDTRIDLVYGYMRLCVCVCVCVRNFEKLSDHCFITPIFTIFNPGEIKMQVS